MWLPMMANEEPITFFRGKHRWLSNFWSTEIDFESQLFMSVEHAYQAAKTTDPEIRKIFAFDGRLSAGQFAGGRCLKTRTAMGLWGRS